ncbi:hypothetical protein BDM02DRAFT_3117738 [Thelephora ganbajun]|uniref:Uncharacterized protein n=1 Tax=Thelephora ganbajun TaxID=370292 RepID=A0ACB6ZBY1_THEGA|nr:hypothetical protein BDM02DRAFT_3117738 [Thelephora ganbajun]
MEDFKARYGRNPTYIARAPGRVNLIGEHIDYALFGVFPAAVERDILIALAPRPPSDKPGVVAANTESKYTEQTFTPSRVIADADAQDQDAWFIDIDTKKLRWDSYVKAGYYVCSRNPLLLDGVLCAYLNLVSGRLEQLFQGRDE